MIDKKIKPISEMNWPDIKNKLANDKRAAYIRKAKKVDDYINSNEYKMLYDVDNLQPKNAKELKEVVDKLIKKQNSVDIDLSMIDTSLITDFTSLFKGYDKIRTLNLGYWDVSNVESMSMMFYDCKELVAVNLAGWDTHSLEEISFMFEGCESLSTIEGIEDFDTTNLWCLQSAFDDCRSLKQLDLSKWFNKAPRENLQAAGMFRNCINLEFLDFSKWNVFFDLFEYMFINCKKLKADISNFDTHDPVMATGALINAHNIECSWADTAPELFRDLEGNVYEGKQINEMNWPDIETKLANDKRPYARRMVKTINKYIDSPEYKKVYGENGIIRTPLTRTELYNTVLALQKIQGENLDLSSIDVSNIKDSLKNFFSDDDYSWICPIVTLNVSGWNFYNTEDVESVFSGLTELKSINVTNVSFNQDSIARLFHGDGELEEIIGLETWNVADVTDFNKMFAGCSKLKNVNTSKWTARPKNMIAMFNGCSSLTEINLENMSLRLLQFAQWFALNCSQLQTVKFTSTESEYPIYLMNIGGMFSGCMKLQTIENIDKWEMKNVEYALEAFLNCRKLSLDISEWNFKEGCYKKSMLKGAKNIICDRDIDDELLENRNSQSSQRIIMNRETFVKKLLENKNF